MAIDYTNSKDLPGPMATAIEKHDFVAVNGGMSVSRLCDSPQINMLKQRNKVSEDVADKTWSLIYRGMLHVLEQGSESQAIYRASQTVYKAIKKQIPILKSLNAEDPRIKTLDKVKDIVAAFARDNYTLEKERWVIRQTLGTAVKFTATRSEGAVESSEVMELEKTIFETIAMFDRETGTLYLPKICSVATAYKPHLRTQWEREAQIQAFILHHNEMEVKSAMAVMVFKDYSAAQKSKAASYPSSSTQTIPLNLGDPVKTEAYIHERLRMHNLSEQGELPECTAEDRWATADSYAVIRPHAEKRNVVKKDLATLQGAMDWINENSIIASNCVPDIVPGESRRCKEYCPVRHVCPQHQREIEKINSLQAKK